ncbi:MAG TPA: MlaD family protein [bacterium]|nr:MlaD family protein [bacterium]HQG46569.1 MlaD family protein [bacterium]HQI47580.1 MlaD family protein [bacterium]HQJ64358.1 MlaD family protein [bacterium]HQJ65470.1 MlaD family protein [bacterium]
MTYKKMSYISGVIIFFSAVILLWAILWLSGQRIISSSEYRVFFKFSDVVGLRDRSQVFMRGYRIGWTKGVRFEEDGVVVRVDIKDRFHIPIDSKIEINTLNLIGEKAITIEPGKSPKVLPAEGQLEGQNKDIMIVAKTMLMDLRSRMEGGELDQRIREASSSIKTMNEVLIKVDKKVDALDVPMYNRQIAEIGEAARSIRLAGSEATELAKESRGSVKQVEETAGKLSLLSDQLTGIATRLNSGEGSAGELLQNKEYVKNLNATVTELKLLIEDLKQNPDKYIKVSVF